MHYMKDIHDIKQVIIINFDYLPFIIIFGSMFLILFILLYLSIRKRIPKKIDKQEYIQREKISAKDEALNELRELKKDKLIEQNKYKLFYEKITQIIKTYLKKQYNIETDSKTSKEILYQLKSMQLDYNLVRHIETCFDNFDFAKYSFYKISTKDMYLSLDNAFILFKLEELKKSDY